MRMLIEDSQEASLGDLDRSSLKGRAEEILVDTVQCRPKKWNQAAVCNSKPNVETKVRAD